MDFFDQQASARRRTQYLMLLFGAAVALSLVLNYLVLASFIQPLLKPLPGMTGTIPYVFAPFYLLGELLLDPLNFLRWLWDPGLAFWIAAGSLLSIAVGSAYETFQLARGGPAVAEMLGGRRVDADTQDASERQLRNVVEETAIASAMPMPEVYILDRERGANTFAAGYRQDDVAIGITYGALHILGRDELQGVMAHEFSHVSHGDTLLNMRLMGLVHGLFWPTIVARILLRGSRHAPQPGDSFLFSEGAWARLFLLPIAIPLFVLGGLSGWTVRWIKSRICREREWLADAAAVQYTRNPETIANALKSIGGLLKQGRLDTPLAETASHLYLANCRHESWFGFLSTHPPLLKRIRAIEPGFDGRFPKIRSVPSRDAAYDERYEERVRLARLTERDKWH